MLLCRDKVTSYGIQTELYHSTCMLMNMTLFLMLSARERMCAYTYLCMPVHMTE